MDKSEARKKALQVHNYTLLDKAVKACEYVDERISEAVDAGHFQTNAKLYISDRDLRALLERLHSLKFDVHVTSIEHGHDLWIGWADDQCDPGLNLDGRPRATKRKRPSRAKGIKTERTT